MNELPTRVADKIRRSACGCWIWVACRNNQGYGLVRHGQKTTLAHRAVYELLIGKIPPDLQCDHLCRNRYCVNPAHIELVTGRDNVLRGIGPTAENARKTHCKKGHELSGKNLSVRYDKRGKAGRFCLACRAENQRLAYSKNRAKHNRQRLERRHRQRLRDRQKAFEF